MPIFAHAAVRLCLLIMLFSPVAHAQLRGGDVWGVVRGDNSPGFAYSAFVETPSGRWLAIGPGGALMYSDNQGMDWEYDVITDDTGRPIFGNISDIVVHDGQLVATLVRFELSRGETGLGGPPLPFIGVTRILTSDNNGETWTLTRFPVPAAVITGTLETAPVQGIWLPHLFVTPGGELLAYGTTAQSTGAYARFLGGLIFKKQGSIWTQVAFELGVLQSMSLGRDGELIASGFSSLLQSENGSLWNGYPMSMGNFSLGGQPLRFDEKDLLNGSDITYVNGKYVMQTQQFRFSTNSGFQVVASNQRSVVFESDDPFAPTRDWTGTEVSRVWPRWLNMGPRLLSLVDGAWSSLNGKDWTNVDSSVMPLALSYGRVGAEGVVAIGSSEEVWTSSDAGQTWDKVLDEDPGEDIRILSQVDDVLLGVGEGLMIARDVLYRSVDNGVTWLEMTAVSPSQQGFVPGISDVQDGKLYAPGGADRFIVSEDTGFTWDEVLVPTTGPGGMRSVLLGSGGRLVVLHGSVEVNAYLSDDGGETWVSRPTPLAFEDITKGGLHVGGGRIVYAVNTGIGSFGPRLVTSNDNGVTWQTERPFEPENVSGSGEKGLQGRIRIREIYQFESGVMVIRGDQGELLLSRDLGLTWDLKLNLETQEEAFLDWGISSVLESDGRLIAIASRDSPVSSAFQVNFAYISEDDGDSWRPVLIPTNEDRVRFFSGAVGAEGRLIITGSNGAVYISEPELSVAGEFQVRESESLTIDVDRPSIEGDVTLVYELVSGTALADTDFVPASGELTWADGDTDPQQITIDTIDDPFNNEGDENFGIAFRASLDISGDLVTSWSYEITIADDDLQVALPTAVDIEVDGAVRTSENGESVTFGVALWSRPSQNVTIDISVDNENEVAFEPSSLFFTPENFKQVQPVTVTGLDDTVLDGNRTVAMTFDVASAGADYDRFEESGVAYIINEDNEVPEIVFADGFE